MARVIKAGGDGWQKAAALELTDMMEEARLIVLEARKEAARIVAEARRQAEAAEREAAEKGYQRGRKEGYEEGCRLGEQEIKRKREEKIRDLEVLMLGVIEGITQAKRDLLKQAREEMLEFALALAEKVIGRLAIKDSAAAKANLAKAMKLVEGSEELLVHVNSGDHARLEAELGELLRRLRVKGQVRLVPDEELSPGGVRVFTPRGEIDATVEGQLAKVAAALAGEQEPGGAVVGEYRPARTAPAGSKRSA